ncbi:hypothetical protein LXL04_037295 [Taraxacum kok-saghyz]
MVCLSNVLYEHATAVIVEEEGGGRGGLRVETTATGVARRWRKTGVQTGSSGTPTGVLVAGRVSSGGEREEETPKGETSRRRWMHRDGVPTVVGGAAVVGVRFSGGDWWRKVVRDSELEEEDDRRWVGFFVAWRGQGYPRWDLAQLGSPALSPLPSRRTPPAQPGLDLAWLGSPTLA